MTRAFHTVIHLNPLPTSSVVTCGSLFLLMDSRSSGMMHLLTLQSTCLHHLANKIIPTACLSYCAFLRVKKEWKGGNRHELVVLTANSLPVIPYEKIPTYRTPAQRTPEAVSDIGNNRRVRNKVQRREGRKAVYHPMSHTGGFTPATVACRHFDTNIRSLLNYENDQLRDGRDVIMSYNRAERSVWNLDQTCPTPR